MEEPLVKHTWYTTFFVNTVSHIPSRVAHTVSDPPHTNEL